MNKDSEIISESFPTSTLPPGFTTTPIVFQNGTSMEPLPIDMRFNGSHRLAITMYTLQMIFSAIGNVYVFSVIVRSKLTRINLFLLNLTIADLLVTFLMMPLEIGWNTTLTWDAGDGMCRLMSFFRVFGLYLSSFVLVCFSLDRYFSLINPPSTTTANRRAKTMLAVAWIGSFICSLPQAIIFHVETHPKFTWYEQCVTFNSFPTRGTELAYNFSGFFFLYVFPLTVIVFSYSRILCKMYGASQTIRNDEEFAQNNRGVLDRAKKGTLKMTVIIVSAFFFCWTPYNVMSLWYWFDKKSAQEVDQHVQKALFMFACTNSCVNPIIYGIFHFHPWRKPSIVPPSLQRSRRAPVQSGSTRIYWTPNHCCVMECESSDEDTEGSLPVASSFRSQSHPEFLSHEMRMMRRNASEGNIRDDMRGAFQMEELERLGSVGESDNEV